MLDPKDKQISTEKEVFWKNSAYLREANEGASISLMFRVTQAEAIVDAVTGEYIEPEMPGGDNVRNRNSTIVNRKDFKIVRHMGKMCWGHKNIFMMAY